MGALDRISVAAIGTSIADLEAETLKAEAAGVQCVWAPELFRSSITQAAYLAGRTERIGVGTGIAWAFTRSPFILAVSALDVDEMSGGRFRLGMGAGVKRLNETWHNADYGRPAPHLREAIEATRLIMRQAGEGAPIRYVGEYYDIARDPFERHNTYNRLNAKKRSRLHNELRALKNCSGKSCRKP